VLWGGQSGAGRCQLISMSPEGVVDVAAVGRKERYSMGITWLVGRR
jgi:hypothetical protein